MNKWWKRILAGSIVGGAVAAWWLMNKQQESNAPLTERISRFSRKTVKDLRQMGRRNARFSRVARTTGKIMSGSHRVMASTRRILKEK